MAVTQTIWQQLDTATGPYIFDFLDFCRETSGAVVRTLVSAEVIVESGLDLVGDPVVAATEVQQLIGGGTGTTPPTPYKVRCHGMFTDGAEWDIEITIYVAAPSV